MIPKCPYCGESNAKKLPISNRSVLVVWLVGVPMIIILAGALASVAGDLGPAVGSVVAVVGCIAMVKLYFYKVESNWECPECNQKFNFDHLN